MASITSPGVGSGIDINALVSSLVEAEREPAELRIVQGEVETEAELSALALMKSALAEFEKSIDGVSSLSTFEGRTATVEEGAPFTLSADETAVPGTFDIEVEQLAQAQKLSSTGFADASANVGSGRMTIAANGESFTVDVAAGAQSLADLRDAINDASDNFGVSATIINVDDGSGGTESKLVLTSSGTGTDNELKITVDDDDGNDLDTSGLSALVYDPLGSGTTHMGELQEAKNAIIRFGTETVTRSSNTIEDAIEGVTINLLEESAPGEATTITVALDEDAVMDAVSGFVNGYNGLMSTLDGLSLYDAETQTAGILLGDATLRSVESGLRREMSALVSGLDGGIESLVSLGITTNADGSLEFDTAQLREVMDTDYAAVGEFFAGSNGLASRLETTLDPLTRTGGTIDSRSDSLNSRMTDYVDQRDTLDRRMASLEERLLAQFIAMDATVSSLQTTSSYLTEQFDALSNLVSGSSG